MTMTKGFRNESVKCVIHGETMGIKSYLLGAKNVSRYSSNICKKNGAQKLSRKPILVLGLFNPQLS